ncbi:MAG: hypothetical protein V3S69_04960 [Dehalococcoidales bacterium]
MASQNTGNTGAFIEAQQYSQFIMENLHDGMLPDNFTRDVSDFGVGTTLNVKTVGTATLQEVYEEQPLTYNAIDTSTVTLQITDYVGDAWSISDVLRQDGSQIESLHAMRGQESTRALQEYFETRYLATVDAAQTDNGGNSINGVLHRFAAGETGTDLVMEVEDFAFMRYAFDKANVPQFGRIAIVDPIVELTMNTISNLTNVSNNPHFEGIINEGFAREHRFVKNIYGWDIWTSNRLPVCTGDLASVTMRDAGAVTIAASNKKNIFTCVASDQTKPIMRAWRQPPKVETDRNVQLKRDEFDVTARLGMGAQRVDTIGVIISSHSAY